MPSKNPRRSQTAATAVALTIAGSDSSGGAGAQADLKTFTALGVYGVTAITCIVAETPGKVSRIQAADPEIVREQIELLLKNFPVAGIKTGLLCNAEIVAQVVRSLRKVKERPLVVDPVMVATTGDVLLAPETIQIYERKLLPLATLITPNLDAGKFSPSTHQGNEQNISSVAAQGDSGRMSQTTHSTHRYPERKSRDPSIKASR